MKPVIRVLLIALAVGCSSKPDVKEFPKSANAQEELSNLEMAINNSKNDNLDLLAPVSIADARESLDEAKEMQEDDKSDRKVLKEVALGQAYLERARANAEANRVPLQDVLSARNEAVAAKADSLLPAELAKLDKKVAAETAKMEKEKDDELKEKRSDFITGYRDLELAAIKKGHLGEAKFLIDQATRDGARNLTPKTYAETSKRYKEADEYITQNRHDTGAIETYAQSALSSARELETTVAAAKGVRASTPEETALKMRAEEERMSNAQNALAAERASNMTLSASNTEMEREKKLNAIYEEARSKFSPEEAEVYKQGKNLVIRLRALHFPKSEASLKGENFALLKKVEEVIASFDKSMVMVEGHTDASGGKALNEKLSTERAEAVKQYLEANTPAEKVVEIESTGYGYEKPLASNKSASGRAQNRRVDVIIEPVQL